MRLEDLYKRMRLYINYWSGRVDLLELAVDERRESYCDMVPRSPSVASTKWEAADLTVSACHYVSQGGGS